MIDANDEKFALLLTFARFTGNRDKIRQVRCEEGSTLTVQVTGSDRSRSLIYTHEEIKYIWAHWLMTGQVDGD